MANRVDEDDDDDDFNDDEVVDDWLPEEEPEIEQPKPPPKIDTKPKIDIVQKSKYIVDNVDLYYALCEVEDWEFAEKDDAEQEAIMKTMVVEEYKAGQNVIVEGDGGNEFYIVIATEKTAHLAEIEVVNGNLLAGTEVFLTRLHRGQYFGQKYFITRRSVKRGATCRVPHDSPCVVHIAKVCSEHFEKKHWSDFRNILLGRSVPLIQGLPRKERIQILQSLTIKEFKDKEYIIKQGEKGEECYIIQEGAVKIVETRQDRGQPPQDHYLVTLREGHLFGEMSLVTDEPRVASVISIKTTICLCLTKQVFRGALSDKTFDAFMNEQLKKRKEIRDKREKDAAEEPPPASPALGSTGRPAPSRRFSYRRKSSISVTSEVKEVGTLNVRKLESGTKIINKYIIDKVLGKGAFGEVFLCIDEETGNKYAMKQINRPQARWNEDEANSIKQEIAVMKRMKHANIVELHEVIDDQNARKIYLIQEFMEGGALMPDAETCTPISVTLARKYFRDILRGVCYLHSEGIIHRDIKPQNMLLTGNGTVKIADFGAAAFTEGNAQEKVAFGGTPAFMAPELFLSNTAIDFTKVEGIDVFALGATLYYLIVGRPPWMANNQIDLATKIKNIELTFPNDIIDPHLKHLLRQMLAKDYRTRCNLDSVVVDDWVTFEGSEPLFEEAEDTFGSNYNDFNCVSEDGFDVLKALIIDDSISKRTMLIQQLNVNRHVMCKSCANNDEAIDIMTAATTNCPGANFDFICCELVPAGQPGSDTIQQIRNMGYTGRIIGIAKTAEDTNQYLHHGAHKILRRPISNKEILMLLADLDMLNDATLQASQNSPDKVSQEEVDSAIVSVGKVRSQSIRSVNFPGMDNDEDDSEDNEESRSSAATLQDFQNFRSKSTRNVHGFDDPDNSRNSIQETKGLSRKRGFMVVPYGGVAATSSGSDCEGDRIVFDKPLKTFSINSPEDKRRERREAAMKRSQLAQQYRDAIRSGKPEAKENAKSMMHMLKLQSRKSMLQRRNSKGSNENSTSSAEERLAHMKSTHIPPAHLASAKSTKNVTLPNIDSFIINQVPGEYHEDEDFGINGDDLMDEDSDSDHGDDDDSLVDINKDDDDEDDGEDIGLGGDEIIQMGDVDLDDMFKELMEKKPVDETIEIQQWNHIKVGSILKTPLICHKDGWDAKLGVRFGKHDSIVARSYMEDRTYGCPSEPREGKRCPLAMFSVFDGHNGDAVAIELQMKYADRFRHFLEAYEAKHDFSKHDSSYESKIQQVFEDTCSSLDLDILSRDYARQQKNLRAGIQDIQNYAGSVGVTLAVMPALSKSFSSASFAPPSIQVFVSHVGDCRAVLSIDGVAEQLTEDHKANNKAEKLRVEKAGGWVSGGRVNGTLGVSRSFGDIQFKNYDPSLTSAYGADGESGIWGKGQQVISKPEFRTFVVEPSYEFIIIASDGLWDVFNCQEAVNFVRQQLSATRDLNKAAHELINKAVSRGTQDNTSVLIVAFHQYV